MTTTNTCIFCDKKTNENVFINIEGESFPVHENCHTPIKTVNRGVPIDTNSFKTLYHFSSALLYLTVFTVLHPSMHLSWNYHLPLPLHNVNKITVFSYTCCDRCAPFPVISPEKKQPSATFFG